MEFYFFVKFIWLKLDVGIEVKGDNLLKVSFLVVSNNKDNIVIIDENFLDCDLWIDYRD